MEPIELPDELVNIRHTNIYKTPDGYFTNLADEIISKIHVPVSSKTPFSEPPANYFADLPDTILHKIKREEAVAHTEVEKELHHIEPLLTDIPKRNVYTVPEGYFNNFTVADTRSEKACSYCTDAQFFQMVYIGCCSGSNRCNCSEYYFFGKR